jgi:membrane protein YqaA with SNARE-associated domain
LVKLPLHEYSFQTFILALIIIFAYLIFFAAIIYHDRDKGYDGLKILTSTLGTLAAGVVGYYFGQRQSESSDRIASEANKEIIEKENQLFSSL